MQEAKELYKTDILIQVSDISYGGHLGNDRFLTIAQEARVRFFRSKGWSERDLAGSQIGILITEAHIKYLQEVFLGQTITVTLSLGKTSKCSFELFYDYVEKESGKRVGRVETKIAFFDYKSRKISKCDAFFEALKG